MDQNRILHSFFQNNSLNMLTEEISEVLRCPIIITDSTFHIVSAYSSYEYKDSKYQKAILHSELSIEACTEITRQTEESQQNHFWVESDSHKFCVGILLCADVFMGYILYFSDPSEENFEENAFDMNDLLLCESLLAKQLYIERHCSDSAESTVEEILEDLLEGKYTSRELFEIHISGTYLAHFSPKHLAMIVFSEHSDAEKTFQRMQHLLSEHYHASHPFFYQNKMLLFLHEDHDIRFFYDLSEEFGVKIVISDVLETLYAVKSHYRTMTDIAAYLAEEHTAENVVSERNYALFAELQKLKENGSLIQPEIKELLLYDLANSSELCLTLYTYLTCSHSLKRTAEILFAHSNTVFYRMQKVREEFGVRADEPELHFAYLTSLALALLTLKHEELFILSRGKDEK